MASIRLTLNISKNTNHFLSRNLLPFMNKKVDLLIKNVKYDI